MTESQIQKQIVDYMKQLNYKVYRMQSGGLKARGGMLHLCDKGTPDLLCVGQDGYSLWIEVKTQDGKCSRDQIIHIHDLISRGQNVIVARCIQDLTGVRNAGA